MPALAALAAGGVPPLRGRAWHPETVRKMLQREAGAPAVLDSGRAAAGKPDHGGEGQSRQGRDRLSPALGDL